MSDKCSEFIHDMILANCISATVSRGRRLYSAEAGDAMKARFRNKLNEKLKDLGKSYKNGLVSGEQHVANINKLSAQLSTSFESVFDDAGFPIGRAQKALNLYLKYLWCRKEIKEPPHCPFDRRVIERLPPEARINWTEITRIDQYNRLVAAAKELAAPLSLARWELSTWQLS